MLAVRIQEQDGSEHLRGAVFAEPEDGIEHVPEGFAQGDHFQEANVPVDKGFLHHILHRIVSQGPSNSGRGFDVVISVIPISDPS